MLAVVNLPSLGQPRVGGGAAVKMPPVTLPMLEVVSVYVQPGPASWKPVISVEAAVVPIAPLLMTVWVPWLVIPAEPPKEPKPAAEASATALGEGVEGDGGVTPGVTTGTMGVAVSSKPRTASRSPPPPQAARVHRSKAAASGRRLH